MNADQNSRTSVLRRGQPDLSPTLRTDYGAFFTSNDVISPANRASLIGL